MSELEVQGLSKRYHGKLVVNDVSFRVASDEFFVLLGPSGSGKSTVLRLISGLEPMDQGRILLDGQDITGMEPSKRKVAIVFQDYGLFPNMNVQENIAYGLIVRRLPKREIQMRIQMAAEMLSLNDILKYPVAQLSGGELQRVSIARVLVKDADIYLFDEPISQLDPRLRYRTRQEISMVHRIKRKPSIYITHDQNEAFAMGNHIGVIANGKIQQIGTTDELLHSPANLFVARFIGNPPINLLEGYVQHFNTRYSLRADGIMLMLPPRWTGVLAKLGPQSKLIIGVRPADIIPEWSFSSAATLSTVIIRAQVQRIEPFIGKLAVRLKIGVNSALTAEFEDDQFTQLHVGQVINIGINIDRMHFFHPQTEELLNRQLM